MRKLLGQQAKLDHISIYSLQEENKEDREGGLLLQKCFISMPCKIQDTCNSNLNCLLLREYLHNQVVILVHPSGQESQVYKHADNYIFQVEHHLWKTMLSRHVDYIKSVNLLFIRPSKYFVIFLNQSRVTGRTDETWLQFNWWYALWCLHVGLKF